MLGALIRLESDQLLGLLRRLGTTVPESSASALAPDLIRHADALRDACGRLITALTAEVTLAAPPGREAIAAAAVGHGRLSPGCALCGQPAILTGFPARWVHLGNHGTPVGYLQWVTP